eukprot:7308564-Pyramimonas_sp.AAC.1
MEKGAAVLVVVGYQLQCAVLENGWPQTGRSISGTLGQANAKEKGVGKGEAIRSKRLHLSPPERSSVHKGYERVFEQWSSPLTGIDLRFQGLRQAVKECLANGKLNISTVDSSQ